jgi:hypothetical protein
MTNQVISGLGVSLICGTSIYGEVQNVPEVMETISKIDTTAHNNVGGAKTSRPGFSDTSEISIDLGYTGETAQDAIRTAFYAKTVSTWMIVAPTSATGIARAWTFSGYVSGCGTPVFDKEGNAKMSFKVQPSGSITTLTTAVVGLSALSVTDQGTTGLTIAPTFGATVYGYKVTTDLADTGVCVTATDATGAEVIYVANAIATTATPTASITIPTVAGQVLMVPVVVFKTACVPKVTWIEVTHGYV